MQVAVLANIPEQQVSGETDDDMGEELQACLAGSEEAESAAAKPVSLPILLHEQWQTAHGCVLGWLGLVALWCLSKSKLCLGCWVAAASDLLLSGSHANIDVAFRPNPSDTSENVLEVLHGSC